MELVHEEEAFLLYAKVRKELRITPQVLRALAAYLPRQRRFPRLLLLLLSDAVRLKEAALIDEEVHKVKDGIAEEVPADCSKDLTLLCDNSLVCVGIAGRRVETRSAWVLHLVELS